MIPLTKFKKSEENERGREQQIWIMLKETYLNKSIIFLRVGGHRVIHMIIYVQWCRVRSAIKICDVVFAA
jgi:hypothetical protein